jgi:predicted porin
MKKTLVALAVLAASGASFAQVTITGTYGYGYKASTSATSGSASGLGISDSNVVFGVSEDLGGGMKVAAQTKIDALNRAKIAGGDSFVALSSGYGTLTMGLAEYDTDTADQFGTFMGATILGGGTHGDSERIADFMSYSTSFGPVGVSFRHTEAEKALGAGAAGSKTQRENTIAASYAAGPLSVKADYTSFDNKDVASSQFFDSRTTLGGNYDLGVVKLGLGLQNTKYAPQGSALETFVGATIPLGALAVGVDYLSVKVSDTGAATDGTATGYGIQAKYNLSKRTDVRLRYANYDASMNPSSKDSYTSLVLEHSF